MLYYFCDIEVQNETGVCGYWKKKQAKRRTEEREEKERYLDEHYTNGVAHDVWNVVSIGGGVRLLAVKDWI